MEELLDEKKYELPRIRQLFVALTSSCDYYVKTSVFYSVSTFGIISTKYVG